MEKIKVYPLTEFILADETFSQLRERKEWMVVLTDGLYKQIRYSEALLKENQD